jgi:hypothetical protein
MNPLSKAAFTFCAIGLLMSGCSTAKQTSTSSETKKSNWIVLFDGKSTDAWRAFNGDTFPEKSWKVENGSLATIVGGGLDSLVTKEKFESFELQLEWKISPGGNSGIMYHVAENFKQPWNTGPECQVLDDSKHPDGKNPKTSAGALYALIAPKNKVLKPVGEWNQARVIINHNHGEHWLNGVKVVEYELNSPELNKLIAESKFKDMPRFAKEATGHICLQHHHDAVWFRNVKVKRL